MKTTKLETVPPLPSRLSKTPWQSSPTWHRRADAEVVVEDNPAADDPAAYVLLETLPMKFDKLERSLKIYMKQPAMMESPEPITVQALPIVEDTPAEILKAQFDG